MTGGIDRSNYIRILPKRWRVNISCDTISPDCRVSNYQCQGGLLIDDTHSVMLYTTPHKMDMNLNNL